VQRRFAQQVERIRERGGRFAPMPAEGREQLLELVAGRVSEMESAGLIPDGWFERIRSLAE
jgi:hypothetical protein